MKRLLTSLCVGTLVLSASAAVGQTPPSAIATPSQETLDLARHFVTLTEKGEDYLKAMRVGAMQTMPVGDEAATSTAAAELERWFAMFEPKVREHTPRINEARAQVYARKFSADELRQLITFAESSAGKRYLSSALDIESEPAVMAASQAMLEDMNKVGEEFAKQACKKRAEERLAAGDTKAKCKLSTDPAVRSS